MRGSAAHDSFIHLAVETSSPADFSGIKPTNGFLNFDVANQLKSLANVHSKVARYFAAATAIDGLYGATLSLSCGRSGSELAYDWSAAQFSISIVEPQLSRASRDEFCSTTAPCIEACSQCDSKVGRFTSSELRQQAAGVHIPKVRNTLQLFQDLDLRKLLQVPLTR